MKRFLLFTSIVLLLCTYSIQGQRLASNTWINKAQDYYKIKVAFTDWYQVDAAQLSAAGVPVENWDASKLQMWYRGKEIPIRVNVDGSGKVSNVVFYGKRNDGQLDSLLFKEVSAQGNKERSFYTDTSVYFLTQGTTDGKRWINKPSMVNGSGQNTVVQTSTKEYNTNVNFSFPIYSQFGIYGSELRTGGGFVSSNQIFTPANSNPVIITESLPTPHYAGGSAELYYDVNGNSDFAGQELDHRLKLEISPDGVSYTTLLDTTFGGFKRVKNKINLAAGQIGNNTRLRISILGVNNSFDAITFRNFAIKYTANLNTGFGRSAWRENSSGSASYIVSGASAEPNLYVVDEEAGMLYEGAIDGSNYHYTVDAGNAGRSLHMWAGVVLPYNESISKAQFLSDQMLTGDHDLLVVHAGKFAQATQEYVTWKKSIVKANGEAYNPVAVNIDQLYDEFLYGYHSPAAIQNYLLWMYRSASRKPESVFLIGKGWEIGRARTNYVNDLIPMHGYPPSDLLLVDGLDDGFTEGDTTIYPEMSIGRLPATTEVEVRNYFEKLKEHEQNAYESWRKTLIHIGGGDNNAQIKKSHDLLTKLEGIAGDKFIGATTNRYYSGAADNITTYLKGAIQGNINSGAALLTYLAHGSLEVLGINIGDTNLVKNPGRYPIMYFNGCDIGNPGYKTNAVSDFYLFAPQKGAIAWLAHGGKTLDNVAMSQMEAFYNAFSKSDTAMTLGEAIKQTLTDQNFAMRVSAEYRSLGQQLILQGDPTLKMPFGDKPEYTVPRASVGVNPEELTVNDNFFDLRYTVRNFGRYDVKGIPIIIWHERPNGMVDSFDTIVAPIAYQKELVLRISTSGKSLQGLNKFGIELDSENKLGEANRANNLTLYSHFFAGSGVKVLFPMDYGIVGLSTPILSVQSRDLRDSTTGFVFELDTVPTFNSPVHMQSGVRSGKNVMVWAPQLPIKDSLGVTKDSVVYYWRSRLNLPLDSGGEWQNPKSFTYIKGSGPGWSQSHFPQYLGMRLNNLTMDTTARRFDFGKIKKGYTVNFNYFQPNGLGIKPDDELNLNGGTAGGTNLVLIQFSGNTLEKVYKEGHPDYMQRMANGTLRQRFYLQFTFDIPSERERFRKYVDSFPDGDYIMAFRKQTYSNWNTWMQDSVFERSLRKIGWHRWVDTIKSKNSTGVNYHYVCIASKFDAGGITIADDLVYDDQAPLAGDGSDIAEARAILSGTANPNGVMESLPIGPSSNWKDFFFEFAEADKQGGDSVTFEILGINRAGQEISLGDTFKTSGADLTWIDAKLYPYIKLRALVKDPILRTAMQLKLWQVHFDGLPEGSIVQDSRFVFHKDTLRDYDTMRLAFPFKNISQKAFSDSLVARIYMTSNTSGETTMDSLMIAPLKQGQTQVLQYSKRMEGLEGGYRIEVRVNEDFAVAEESIDNNILKMSTFIKTDETQPVMQVFVNNRVISNGELLPYDVTIDVMGRDENIGRPLNDTAYFSMWMQTPNDESMKPIYFSDSRVSFSPSNSPEDWAKVKLVMNQLPSGTYIFRVQLRDASGNVSGNKAYTISFRILREDEISNIYAYPNPARENVNFSVFISGNRAPENVTLDIVNMQGYVVKTLTKADMGTLKVGPNSFNWDLTMANGQKLPSGLYFYIVTISDADKNYNKYFLEEDYNLEGTKGRLMIVR